KQRDIHWTSPKGEPLSGAYLIEASATLGDGRIIGNRSIICTSDFLLTQKRTPTKVIMRVTKMSDVQSVVGMTVRTITNENIEIARATTDAKGMATFDRDKVLPAKGSSPHLFIADTPNGPAVQFAEAGSYPSGERSGLAAKPHAEIITDRNLYRPGQTVKMKGIVRDVSDARLAIPTATDAQWRVMEGDGNRVVGEGNVALSSYGGWEAEWNVPEKAKLGHYIIDCRVSGKDYEGSTRISIEEYRVPLFSVVVEAKPEVGQTAHAHVSSAYFHGAPKSLRSMAKRSWAVTWRRFFRRKCVSAYARTKSLGNPAGSMSVSTRSTRTTRRSRASQCMSIFSTSRRK